MGSCVSLPIYLMMIVRICLLHLIINIKSEIWPICHCLGFGMPCMSLYILIAVYYTRSWSVIRYPQLPGKRVTHICVGELGRHWFEPSLVAFSVPNHSLPERMLTWESSSLNIEAKQKLEFKKLLNVWTGMESAHHLCINKSSVIVMRRYFMHVTLLWLCQRAQVQQSKWWAYQPLWQKKPSPMPSD